MKRLIPLNWRQSRANHVLISLGIQTAKVIIKLTQIYAYFGNTASIRNSIPRNTKSFIKTEDNQFVQL